MLREFKAGRIFNKLEAVLHVDCVKADAQVVILYDRRIRRIEAIPFHEVATPELAEAWMVRPAAVAEHGSWLEWHATMCARDPSWLVAQPKGDEPKPASHPDFYPPELGGKPQPKGTP